MTGGEVKYFGKPKNSHENECEELSLDWLNENHFSTDFLTLCRDNSDKWYPVPVEKSRKRRRSAVVNNVSDNDHLLDSLQSTCGDGPFTPTFHNQGHSGYCVAFSLASAYSFLGLSRQEVIILRSKDKILKSKNQYNTAVQVIKSNGMKSVPLHEFNVFKDSTPQNMKFCQICATPVDHFDDDRYHDNKHCVVLLNGLIFDSNQHTPLPLTTHSLNECCVGDDMWVFHHMSRVSELIPNTKTQKYLDKVMKKNNKSNKRMKL